MKLATKSTSLKRGTWIIKQVPTDLMVRARIAGLSEGKTVRQFLIDLVDAHLANLEKQGRMPRSK